MAIDLFLPDFIFVMGGNDGTQSLTTSEALEHLNSHWRPAPSLNTGNYLPLSLKQYNLRLARANTNAGKHHLDWLCTAMKLNNNHFSRYSGKCDISCWWI